MIQTLAQTTRTAPDCGTETSPAPVSTASPSPIPEGFKAWLPALVVLIAMPLLALATTTYVLIPSMKQAFTPLAALSRQSAADGGTSRPFLAKIPFNASGIRSLALVGSNVSFKNKVAQNKAKLTSLAAVALDGIKSTDLYNPAVLDATRARLRSDFNHALGGSPVQEVYISVWPEK
jgi:hypothetical protein